MKYISIIFLSTQNIKNKTTAVEKKIYGLRAKKGNRNNVRTFTSTLELNFLNKNKEE